ncbi:Bacteriohemerythrin [Ferriphaselus amnicola]|uniref:Bacteriohemerythrin n=1 Tax=Ferriphaselus amnicola TaxID=1188319 RepID=A0A2Z6GE45_9PROT|nr:hemerythrin domain-containing protein [Ferriphaselus amnicola]BBE51856.1 Bacteriohemerythrin [Ferriphaselus amnicola]
MSSPTKSTPWRLTWTDDLSVCDPEIDAEHKHFIMLVNELNGAIISRLGIEEIKRCMRAIVDDAVAHFAHEERLFKEWCYLNASEHALKHAEAIQYFHNITEGFERNGTDYEWIETGLKVKQAFIGHLLEEDLKYRDYCRENCKC